MNNVCLPLSITLKQLVVFYTLIIQLSRGIRGQASDCENVRCNSENNSSMICHRPHKIFSATVKRLKSKSPCDYFNGSSIDYLNSTGAFGYNDDILWVTKGCRAKFWVCYTGGQQPTSALSSDASSPTATRELSDTTPPSTQRLNYTSLFTSTVSKKLSVTDYFPLTTSYEQTNKWHTSEPQKHEPSQLMIGVTVIILVIILVGLIVLAIVLIKKRQRRQRLLENQKRDHCPEMKERVPYDDRTAECYYETIQNEDENAKLKSSEGNTNNYFVLEPGSQHATSVDADSSFDCKLLKTTERDNTQTQVLKPTKDDSHTYFIIEPQTKSPLDESISPRDDLNSKGKTALRGPDCNFSLLNMTSEDAFSSIDDESIAVQSLPDNEYNMLHIKSKSMGQQRNYDTLEPLQHGQKHDREN